MPFLTNPSLLTPGAAPASYAAAVLADSPLAYYRLGEASGTTMVDSSGNSHNGSYTGSPTLGTTGLVTGDSNTAVAFNGTSQYGQTAFGSWMSVSHITLEAIIKPTSVSGQKTFIDRDGFPDVGTFVLQVSSGKVIWFFWLDSGGIPLSTLTSATTVVANTKYHVAVTYDGTVANMYINGTLDATLTASPPAPLVTQAVATPLSIGVQAEPGGGTPLSSFFAGTIDEVAYYDYAVSATRIAAHAALV